MIDIDKRNQCLRRYVRIFYWTVDINSYFLLQEIFVHLDLRLDARYILDMSDKADFGQAVVFLADKAGLSQKALARYLDVTPATVSAWNNGRQYPNHHAMQLLPGALGCSMDEILAVAAYHAQWRQKLRHRKQQAGAVSDVRTLPPSSEEGWHQEMGLHLKGVVDLLAARIAQKLSAKEPNWPP